MYPGVKRVGDLVAASILLLLLFPVVAIVGVLVFVVDGRPVFFRQVRPGLGGKPFVMVKFRTMSMAPAAADGDENARLTKLGVILRKTSIDEIPSLWNVVRGDLSLVGPRPLLMDYLDVYSSVHSRRHAVRPGVTGLAQVAGRNLVSWKERLDLDVLYVERQSLGLDIKILLKTIRAVFSFRGVNQADGSTMVRLTKGYDTK